MRNIVSLFLLLLSLAHPVLAVSAEKRLDLSASATTTRGRKVFEKYLFSFQNPSPMNFIGLSGYVSLSSNSQNLEQSLLSIQVLPSGNCPPNGARFDTYGEIFSQYPAHSISNFILKSSSPGTIQVPTEFALPVKVPITGCVFIILDGGDPAYGDPLTMESRMILRYDTEPAPSPAPFFIPIDDEFCYGQSWGCQLATTCTSPNCAFARSIPINSRLYLWSLSGNVSTGAFTGSPFTNPPTGGWTSNFDYYLYKSCTLTSGVSGPSDYYSQIPSGAVNLLNITQNNTGKTSAGTFGFKSFEPMVIESGNCLVNLAKFESGNGGATLESQIFALVQPVPSSPPSPTTVPLAGDINNDNQVNIFDYNLLVASFGKTGSAGFVPADIDKNGKVDIFDYNVLVANFGK